MLDKDHVPVTILVAIGIFFHCGDNNNYGRCSKGRAKYTISPLKLPYDMDVEIRPAYIYDHIAGEVRI